MDEIAYEAFEPFRVKCHCCAYLELCVDMLTVRLIVLEPLRLSELEPTCCEDEYLILCPRVDRFGVPTSVTERFGTNEANE